MKKEAATFEEAEAIVNPLLAEKKWAISVIQKVDQTFVIQWVEHKKYTAQDGQQFHDEVWTTKEGDMKLVQDLEPEHARNILRLLLRNERQAKEEANSMFEQIANEFIQSLEEDSEESLFPGENDDYSIVDESFPEPKSKTLH